jgi:hypothetical protein
MDEQNTDEKLFGLIPSILVPLRKALNCYDKT